HKQAEHHGEVDHHEAHESPAKPFRCRVERLFLFVVVVAGHVESAPAMSRPDSEAGADRKVLAAGADAAGRRLDQWLAGELGPELSRSRVQALIRDGFVSLDGNAATDPGRKIAAGARVVLTLPE